MIYRYSGNGDELIQTKLDTTTPRVEDRVFQTFHHSHTFNEKRRNVLEHWLEYDDIRRRNEMK